MAKSLDIKLQCFLQILENQEHILYFIGQMKKSGNISNGLYCGDGIGNDLIDATQKLKKELQNQGG